MAVSALGYLGIGVSDLDRWRKYATTEVLGMQEMGTASDGAVYMRIDEYHHRFVFHPTGEDDVKYVGWEVRRPDDIDEIAAKLRDAGVHLDEGTADECAHRKVVRMIKFSDPSGVPTEVFFGGLQLSERPFQPSRPISGFNAGSGLGLGHMVLRCKDMQATVKFYKDLLGFKLSDYIDMTARSPQLGNLVFFHVNPRHHSVAFAQVPVPKYLAHFMVELKSFDDIGFTYDEVLEKGYPLSMSLGRHTNDHMTSFYLKSPSGFDIEYGWGGRLIDDNVWVVQQHVAPSTWGHKPAHVSSGGNQ